MRLLERIGKGTEQTLEAFGGIGKLLIESCRLLLQMQLRVEETVEQAVFLGIGSTSIVLLTAFFTGMVFSLESAVQAVNYGVGSIVGAAVSFTTAREIGPMLSGVVIAGRAAAAIAAQLGSMVVTEQIEALQALGLNPTRMLVVPRLVALVVMMPLLTVLADVVSIAGGMWIARQIAHIDTQTFIQSMRNGVAMSDFLRGMLKSAVFGVLVSLIGCYFGLRTRGGAAGVGTATTHAVVIAIISIFIANFIMSYLLFGTQP